MARLVPLTVCYSLPDVVVLRSKLSAYGIYSTAIGLAHGAVDWRLLTAFHGIELWVLDVELSQARAFLEREPVASGDEPAFATEAQAFRMRPFANFALAFLVLLLAGLPFPFWVRRRHG